MYKRINGWLCTLVWLVILGLNSLSSTPFNRCPQMEAISLLASPPRSRLGYGIDLPVGTRVGKESHHWRQTVHLATQDGIVRSLLQDKGVAA